MLAQGRSLLLLAHDPHETFGDFVGQHHGRQSEFWVGALDKPLQLVARAGKRYWCLPARGLTRSTLIPGILYEALEPRSVFGSPVARFLRCDLQDDR